jgi:hypothetical protein
MTSPTHAEDLSKRVRPKIPPHIFATVRQGFNIINDIQAVSIGHRDHRACAISHFQRITKLDGSVQTQASGYENEKSPDFASQVRKAKSESL